MVNQIFPTPTIPIQHAGEIAASADMNQLALAAAFVLNKPITILTGGTCSAASGSTTYVTFPAPTAPIVDTDGLWMTSGETVPVQRFGYYAYDCMVHTSASTNIVYPFVGLWAGGNSPFASEGTNFYTAGRYGYAANSQGGFQLRGIMPVPLWPLDYLGVGIYNYLGSTVCDVVDCQLTIRWIGE